VPQPVPHLLEARQLEASRDDRVLFTGLDFRLAPGTMLQVTGRNGVGKTTLLNLVAGLSRPAGGEVLWGGQPVAQDYAGYLGSLSFLGHLGGLKLALTPLENLHFLCRLRGLEVPAATLWAALKKVGLYGYEEVAVGRLSAGQKRRAALARLFVEGTPLWILDEPFTAIDKGGVDELETWLGGHLATGGMILLTTHHEFTPQFPLQRLDVATFRPRRSA
jgi:heme exporter protein A